MGSDQAFIPSPGQTPLEGVTVSQMIADDVKVDTDGAVTGTIKYLSEMPEYEQGQKEGHFFPTRFTEKNYNKQLHVGGEVRGEGFTAGKDFEPSAEDPYLVIRVENLTDKKVSVYDAESKNELFKLDFNGATLQENPAALSARRSRKVAKPLTE